MKCLNWSWVKHVGRGERSKFYKRQEIGTFGENEYKYGLTLTSRWQREGKSFPRNNVGCWAEGRLKGDFEPALIRNNFWHYREAKQCFIELDWFRRFTLNSWKINRYLIEDYGLCNPQCIAFIYVMHDKAGCLSFDGDFMSKTSYIQPIY